jgi:hypothetical protein
MSTEWSAYCTELKPEWVLQPNRPPPSPKEVSLDPMEQQVVIAEGLLPQLKQSRTILERGGFEAALVRPPGCDTGS